MNCIARRENHLERIEQGAVAAGALEIGEQISVLRARLMPTFTPEQRRLYGELEDLIISEGTARTNGALMAVCGCPECIESMAAII